MYTVANRNFETLDLAEKYCIECDFNADEMIEEITFTYGYRLRPPSPGCQPKQGIIRMYDVPIVANGYSYHGTVEYSRELTPAECYDYDLDLIIPTKDKPTVNTDKTIGNAKVRMSLNSDTIADSDFSKDIQFIAEEFVENDIPVWHTFDNIKDAMVKAYTLQLQDKLHNFSVYNKVDRTCHGTNALNYFVPIDHDAILKENEALKEQLSSQQKTFDEFLSKYNSYKIFEEFKNARR